MEGTKQLYECNGTVWMPKSVGGQSVGGTCDIGWMKHENKCYKIHRTKKNWMTAQVKLQSMTHRK